MKSSVLLEKIAVCFYLASLLLPSAISFLAPRTPSRYSIVASVARISQNNEMDQLANVRNDLDGAAVSSTVTTSRREWIEQSFAVVAVSSSMACWSSATPATAAEESTSVAPPKKILVLGGTGLVGSQIRQILVEQGIPVVATSRNGRDGTVALDFLTSTNVAKQVEELAKGCSAVISTIGVLGTPDDTRVNAANALAAAGAKAAGVPRFVYITVAPQVKDLAKNVDFLQAYMQGKTFSRDAVIHYFGEGSDGGSSSSSSYTLIEPTFIYGGDKFQVNPPRVTGLYGSLIEGALSSAPLRLASNLVPGGLFKVALEPPVSAEAVAKAAIAGALGKTNAILDTYDKIQEAANQS